MTATRAPTPEQRIAAQLRSDRRTATVSLIAQTRTLLDLIERRLAGPAALGKLPAELAETTTALTALLRAR